MSFDQTHIAQNKVSLTEQESAPLVKTIAVFGILVVDIIIKAMGTMKETIEWQILPISLLLEFGASNQDGWNFWKKLSLD